VAQWLGERLARPGDHDTARDAPLLASGRWPRAARFNGTSRCGVVINAYPHWADRPGLSDFLRYNGKPLSARATRGFLSRTERAKLRFADGFQDRLRDHLRYMEGEEGLVKMEYAVAAE
jgi:DNA (cytosine-5)-methyltransferase 1